jgi:H+/Cl- antiporter ClcA
MLFAILFFGIAGTTAGAWSRHVLPHKLDQIASVPDLIKLACTGVVVVASGLFADALRRRFYSD